MENLKFLVSFFGSFNQTDFQPTSENQKYYLDQLAFLGQMIPNVVQEISSTGQQNLLGMRSIDNSWNITFHGSRINIEKNNTVGVLLSKEQFIEHAKRIIEKINNKTHVQFHRIGFVSNYIIKNKKQSEVSSTYFKFNIPTVFYSNSEPVEWNSRVIARKQVNFNNDSELLNVSTEIKSVQGILMKNGKPENVIGFELGFDVNSFQNNQSHRFNAQMSQDFLELLAIEEQSMNESILNQI